MARRAHSTIPSRFYLVSVPSLFRSTFEHTEELKRLRELSAEQVQAEFDANIPQDLAPAPTFWDSYNAAETTIGLRACLILWEATSGRLVPREFQ